MYILCIFVFFLINHFDFTCNFMFVGNGQNIELQRGVRLVLNKIHFHCYFIIGIVIIKKLINFEILNHYYNMENCLICNIVKFK